jgi:hypothetical protein
MKKLAWLLAAFVLFSGTFLHSQIVDEKTYAVPRAGDVQVIKSWGEWNGKSSEKVFQVKVTEEAKYYISALANLPGQSFTRIKIDNKDARALFTEKGDWKWIGNEWPPVVLTPGLHEIRIDNNSPLVPMVDDIFLFRNSSAAAKMPEKVSSFFENLELMKKQAEGGPDKVLPNPEGTYTHAIDTAFTYSHYSTIYLTAGNHQIMTNGSTTTVNLVVYTFSSMAYSGANSGGGLNGEALLNVPVAANGYYTIMLRPVSNSGSGVTNIVVDGSVVTSNAVIGGKRFSTPSLNAGLKNFFTCRLSSGDDTRLIVSKFSTSSARAYNDDYNGPGTFNWGYASRVVKDFTGDEVQYAFVCAYSPTSYGTCDVYLANENSNVYKTNYPEFPLLEADDAIKAAPSSGYYNCISWSGGVTSTWIWPPYLLSTYNCTSGTPLTCFDNFYNNQPLRYPGAFNFTRTGATNANSIVDLWALDGAYTHASVKKPGNNHPHGYDWESKPGGLTRTFHPRTALTNNSWGYGSILNYYILAGGSSSVKLPTDKDAVEAGLAIIDKAKLTDAAQAKLRLLVSKINPDFVSEFNRLYEAWDKTKEKNAIYSDPNMYCQNAEYNALAALIKKNARNTLVLTMDKFVNNNDVIVGVLLLTLAQPTYAHLLTEVKQERAAKPNDDQGRYRIHGDHDNGVLYIEKILKDLQPLDDIQTAAELTTVSLSPNPVSDRYTVKLALAKEAMVSVKAVYTRSGRVTVLQQPAKLSAGVYMFNGNLIRGLVPSGEMITIQAEIDGVVKTIKGIVLK